MAGRIRQWGWVALAAAAAACAGQDDGSLQSFTRLLHPEQERIEFSTTDVGVTVDVQVAFSNPGTGTVTAQARLEGNASVVMWGWPTLVVEPGDAGHFTLRNLALSPGQLSAVLVVTHDGEPDELGRTTLRLPVTGVVRAPPVCDDGNPCTLDSPDPAAAGGCRFVPRAGSCDDGNACTTADACLAGVCVGAEMQCNDGALCTVDVCDPNSGQCRFEPVAARCDDGDACTEDICRPGPGADLAGCAHSVAPTGTPCGELGCGTVPLCVAGACVVQPTPEGFPCEDGDPCTNGDSCHAGACQPGPGGGLQLGAPVVVQDPVPNGDGPLDELPDPSWISGTLGGFQPVAVAAANVMVSDAQPPWVRMLWRGTVANGGYCHEQMSSCVGTPPAQCLEQYTVPRWLSLVATTAVVSSGSAIQHVVLDTNSLHRQIRQQLNAQLSDGVDPAATVAAVAAVPSDNGSLEMAVMVRFADTCVFCDLAETGDAQPTPRLQGDDTQPYTCLPGGAALAIYQVDDQGFRLRFSRWLGATASSNQPRNLAEDDQGQPLLAVADHQGTFNVAWAYQTECLTGVVCDAELCDCPGSLEVHALALAMTPDASARYQQREFVGLAQLPWTGGQNIIRDFSMYTEGGGPRVLWRQRMEGSPPPVALCSVRPDSELTDLVELWMADDDDMDDYVGSQTVAPLAAWGARLPGPPGGGSLVVWESRGIPSNQLCMTVDDVSIVSPSGERTELMHVDAADTPAGALTSVSAAVVAGRPVAMAVNVQGQVGVGMGTTPGGASRQAWTGFDGNADVQFHTRSVPVAAMSMRAGAVVGLGETGLYRDSFPDPLVVMAPLTCGAVVPGP